MPKKILFVTVLLLLISVQALAASCDLRCSLMGASTGGQALHSEVPVPHCHGMSMERGRAGTLSANDSCASTTCGTELKALKSADKSDTFSSKLLVSAVALLADPLRNAASSRTTASTSFGRSGESRPLAQRPGSSLRI
jgi:hypothetical protein